MIMILNTMLEKVFPTEELNVTLDLRLIYTSSEYAWLYFRIFHTHFIYKIGFNIDVFREFNDVNFVVRSYTDLILSNISSEIINVCTGKALSIQNILDAMANIAGYKIKVNINPMFVRSNEIRTLKGATKKMNHIIGDFTEEFEIENTLREMYHN